MSDKIVTHFDPKPIPTRRFDWSATSDNYEADLVDGEWRGSHPIGYGATEQEAINEYRSLTEDDE